MFAARADLSVIEEGELGTSVPDRSTHQRLRRILANVQIISTLIISAIVILLAAASLIGGTAEDREKSLSLLKRIAAAPVLSWTSNSTLN